VCVYRYSSTLEFWILSIEGGYCPLDGANVNTRFAYTNLGVMLHYMFVDIIWGELNIIDFTFGIDGL
jgi:hypothetical protein